MGLIFKKKRARSFTESSKSDNALKKLITKAAGLVKPSDRGEFETPEYDLEEIKVASESDSYIRSSFLKYSYLLFKAGYKCKSDNSNALDYLKTRLYMMGFATGKPIDILFEELGDDLVKYSNAFLVKSRMQEKLQGVNAKPAFGKKGVVGGYFRISPNTLEVKRDENGTIKQWVQKVGDKEKKYDATEVIHFYIDKDAENVFGTPRIIAALEDVKLLRSIEGNIATMIYRFAMPLFHWIVGLPQTGFQATNKEIDEAEEVIDKLSIDGSVVTNEKTQIKVIGAEGQAISAEGYLKYFEQRVFAALNTSESQMGRGGAKQDADSMEGQAHDTVKHIQKMFATFTEFFIFNEILLEGGFDPITKKEDRVEMVFEEINLDTKIKLENHEVYKYQSNSITFEEMRRKTGMDDKADEKRLYDNLIKVSTEKQFAKVRADESIRIAKESHKLTMQENSAESNGSETSGKKGVNPNGNGNTGSKDPDKKAENTQMPENQHGKTSIKIKEKNLSKNQHIKKYKSAYEYYRILMTDCKNNIDDIGSLSKLAEERFVRIIMENANESSFDGIKAASKDATKKKGKFIVMPSVNIGINIIEEDVRNGIEKILSRIQECIKNGDECITAFERNEYRLRFLIEFNIKKAYWNSYVLAAKSMNIDKAYIHFDDSKDKDNHDEVIDLNNISLDNIPPFHPFCDCKINLFKKEK